MILLVSQDSLEPSTEEVENWLHVTGADYLRINGSDILQMCSSSITVNSDHTTSKFILSNGIELDLSKVNVVWFRRWQYYPTFDTVVSTGDISFEKNVNEYRISEFKSLSSIFCHLVRNKRIIGSPRYLFTVPTKFEQLEAARNTGFTIPKSLITNSKKELMKFYVLANKKIITKPSGEGTCLTIDKSIYGTYTSLITDDILDLIPDNFYPSLFQELIEKEVELRVFYLNKKCYAMAIFSTLDKQTEVDFRIYNEKKPNRNAPFNLPEDIQKKIVTLMESVGLTTGSLDLILNTKNEFVFLEINHAGQFGMVSFPCNYYLEEVIANELMEFDYNHN